MASRKTAKSRTKAKPAARKTAPRRAQPRKAAPRAQSAGLALTGMSVSLTVNDLQKSLAWYRDVLGFTVSDRWEREGTLVGAELKAGDGAVMLGQDDWKKGRDRAKGEGVRIYSETTQDVDRLAAQIKARGGTLSMEPQDASWGARAFAIDDPDGFKLTIYKQQRRRK
jgi:uncharacterized glyoxalase superfamily protein PhnB